MKILGIVILYYPNIEEVASNINRYIEDIDYLIVWDNTPEIDKAKHQFSIDLFQNKIKYLATGRNEGISYALNQGLKHANSNGFTHLLTMDQDSEWSDFKKYKEFALTKPQAIIGPLINNEVFIEELSHPDYIITSGMIIPTTILNKIGGYWEEFKVDGIDTELCYRAKKSGIEILKAPAGRLYQKFGNSTQIKLFGRRFTSPQYSPYRLYGITRSCGIIMRKYATSHSLKKDYFRYTILFSIFIILNEKKKVEKLYALWRGVWSGWTCSLSKLQKI